MLALIPLFPLIGFVINAMLGRRLPKSVSGWLASLAMLASFAVSAMVVWQLVGLPAEERVIDQTLYTWLASGDFNLPLAFRLDPLSAVMILVVTGIGSLIHIYSTAYMHDEVDSEFARYFSYLNLFASFMLVLVLGSNFPVMFVGWEGVGLCSYLLIGFWFRKRSAADAGKKADRPPAGYRRTPRDRGLPVLLHRRSPRRSRYTARHLRRDPAGRRALRCGAA